MARKTVSRKKIAAEIEAADKAEAKKKTTKKKAKKKSTRKKKAAENVRMKLYWGVFSQSMKRIALYEFNQRKAAEKKAEDMTKSGKSPHFVQRVKEAIEEEA